MSVDERKIEEEFRKRVEEVSERDIKRAVEESDRIVSKTAESSILRRELAKVKLLVSALKDYWNEEYREIPYGTIAAIVVALIYILSPIDLIPDFIPVLGQMDDLAMLMLVWKLISEDIREYALWKIEQGEENVRKPYEEAFV